jgi:hypothetical protein
MGSEFADTARLLLLYGTVCLLFGAIAAQIARWIRAHWNIEAIHHIRDVTYREDHSQIRTGSGPAVMAALRTLAIAVLKFCGWTNITKANRHHHQDPRRCLTTVGLPNRHRDT